MHNWPGMKVGQFGADGRPDDGLVGNEFQITIRGRGAHAALPHNGVDPVLVATASWCRRCRPIITRNKKPIDAAVLSVTEIHAGEAINVIPDNAEIQGTVRTFSIEMLDLIERRMREIVEHTAAGLRLQRRASTSFATTRRRSTTRRETDFCARGHAGPSSARPIVHRSSRRWAPKTSRSCCSRTPGCYVFIGNGDGRRTATPVTGSGPCMLHNSSYDFNDELIPIGATVWVRLVERFLAPQ